MSTGPGRARPGGHAGQETEEAENTGTLSSLGRRSHPLWARIPLPVSPILCLIALSTFKNTIRMFNLTNAYITLIYQVLRALTQALAAVARLVEVLLRSLRGWRFDFPSGHVSFRFDP